MSKENTLRLELFSDPLYGSELFVTVDPDWVEEAEDRMKSLLFRPKAPVTFIRFKNGETHTVHGHWAEHIKTEQARATQAQK
jgi:hypothetical protein